MRRRAERLREKVRGKRISDKKVKRTMWTRLSLVAEKGTTGAGLTLVHAPSGDKWQVVHIATLRGRPEWRLICSKTVTESSELRPSTPARSTVIRYSKGREAVLAPCRECVPFTIYSESQSSQRAVHRRYTYTANYGSHKVTHIRTSHMPHPIADRAG